MLKSGSKFLPGTGLVLSWAMLGLLSGTFIAARLVEGDDAMDGAWKALGHGLIAMLLAAIAAVVVVRRASHGRLLRLLAITGPLALLLLGWTLWSTWRALHGTGDDDGLEEPASAERPMPARLPLLFISWTGPVLAAEQIEPTSGPHLGMGMAAPSKRPGTLFLHFFPDLDLPPAETPAQDSIVFRQGKQGLGIAHAPEWFKPAHHEPARELVLMRVLSVSQDWVELEAGGEEGRTMWVDRSAVELMYWPDLLLSAVSVEPLDAAAHPVRLRPFDHAAPQEEARGRTMRPLAVQGDWLMVTTLGLADMIPPPGFLRWRQGDRLLVEYRLWD